MPDRGEGPPPEGPPPGLKELDPQRYSRLARCLTEQGLTLVTEDGEQVEIERTATIRDDYLTIRVPFPRNGDSVIVSVGGHPIRISPALRSGAGRILVEAERQTKIYRHDYDDPQQGKNKADTERPRRLFRSRTKRRPGPLLKGRIS